MKILYLLFFIFINLISQESSNTILSPTQWYKQFVEFQLTDQEKFLVECFILYKYDYPSDLNNYKNLRYKEQFFNTMATCKEFNCAVIKLLEINHTLEFKTLSQNFKQLDVLKESKKFWHSYLIMINLLNNISLIENLIH